MPLFDYHCTACESDFELLVYASASSHYRTPQCPECGSTALEKAVARVAPAGKIEAIRLSNRRAAAAQGLFNHYSPGEQARLLKGKRV